MTRTNSFFQTTDAGGLAGLNWGQNLIDSGLTLGSTSAMPFTLRLGSLFGGDDTRLGIPLNWSPSEEYHWTFLTATESIQNFSAGSFAFDQSGFVAPTNNGTFSVSQAGNSLALNFTAASAAPEPGSLALLLPTGLLAFGIRRRRRR